MFFGKNLQCTYSVLPNNCIYNSSFLPPFLPSFLLSILYLFISNIRWETGLALDRPVSNLCFYCFLHHPQRIGIVFTPWGLNEITFGVKCLAQYWIYSKCSLNICNSSDYLLTVDILQLSGHYMFTGSSYAVLASLPWHCAICWNTEY